MTKNKSQLPLVPTVGQEIYVPTSLYISHGEDDVLGGHAVVIKVLTERWSDKKVVHGIKVKEHPNVTYYWEEYLAKYQEGWKKEFGDQCARPNPDKGGAK